MKPLNKNLIIEPIEEKTDSVILTPDTATARASFGKVIYTSDDVTKIKAGDIVHWPVFLGVETTIDNKKYFILKEEDILFIE